MYATQSTALNASRPNAQAAGHTASRPARYRNRDFGTGYGNSSGYATGRRYTSGSQPASRFRLV